MVFNCAVPSHVKTKPFNARSHMGMYRTSEHIIATCKVWTN